MMLPMFSVLNLTFTFLEISINLKSKLHTDSVKTTVSCFHALLQWLRSTVIDYRNKAYGAGIGPMAELLGDR